MAALSTGAKIQKRPRRPLIDDRIRKRWTITQPSKRNEISPFLTTRMDPEGVVLSEVNQTEKYA